MTPVPKKKRIELYLAWMINFDSLRVEYEETGTLLDDATVGICYAARNYLHMKGLTYEEYWHHHTPWGPTVLQWFPELDLISRPYDDALASGSFWAMNRCADNDLRVIILCLALAMADAGK